MEALSVQVLGPLAVRRGSTPVDVGGPRQQALLAALLAARGMLVPVDRLVDELWDDHLDIGRKTVSAAISRLRAALGTASDVRFQADGYSLALPAEAVDASRFRLLVAAARARRAAGDLPGAVDRYREAIALWSGETAYAGVPGSSVELERCALDELRWAALEEQAALRLELGEDIALIEELVQLCARDALREKPVCLLATALARSGRRSEALDAVRVATERLREAFGLDPGPELLALEAELLAVPVVPVVPAPREPEPAGLLPLPLSSFVGRAHLLDVVAADLAAHRLITLTGAGGTGKTRLALEHLRGLPAADRSWAPLAALDDAALVPAALAEALGAAPEPGRTPLSGAAQALGRRTHLLVVDNAEHLREPVARALGELLSTCSGLRVLVTSREALGLAGERVLEVPPLAVRVGEAGDGPAVQLFLERAAQGADWEPDEGDLLAVRRICADLDGLPLALELAAARCQALGPVEIAAALSDRFALLASRGPVEVPHHRTLEAAVQWSYDLLTAQEQAQFRALATFDGGFDLAAAQWLTGAGPQVAADLAAKSLVTVERSRRPWRYALLETVRTFALSRTDEHERARLARRHLRWVEQLVGAAGPHVRGPQAGAWLARLERERANIRTAIRTALATGEAETALRLCGDLSWGWFRAAHAAEGRALIEASLTAAPADAPSRGRALVGLCLQQYMLGDPAGALTSALEGRAHAVSAGNAELVAEAEVCAGWMSALVGDLVAAQQWAQSSCAAARRLGLPTIEAEALMVLGQLARFGPDPASAEELLLRAMEVGRSCGHQWAVESSGWVAAKVALADGRPAVAAQRAARLTDSFAAAGDIPALLAASFVLAGAAAALGQSTVAGELAGAVDALGSRIGYSVARMDVLDAGWIAALVEAALTPSQLAEARAKGAQWDVADLRDHCAAVVDRLEERVG